MEESSRVGFLAGVWRGLNSHVEDWVSLELPPGTLGGLWHGRSPRSKVLAHKKLIRHSRPRSRMKGAAGPQYLPTDQEAVGKHWGQVNIVKRQLFLFFFFHFLSLLTAAFLKRKKTAARAAKPCLLEGKERGGGSPLSSGLRRARAARRPTAVSSAAPWLTPRRCLFIPELVPGPPAQRLLPAPRSAHVGPCGRTPRGRRPHPRQPSQRASCAAIISEQPRPRAPPACARAPARVRPRPRALDRLPRREPNKVKVWLLRGAASARRASHSGAWRARLPRKDPPRVSRSFGCGCEGPWRAAGCPGWIF